MAAKKTPYGYTLTATGITISQDEAEIIRRIFSDKIGGMSGASIGTALYNEHIPYFSDSEKKSIDKVYMILGNERYFGRDGYPPVITEETFQMAKESGKKKDFSKKPDTYTILKKMSYCTVCGTNMVHFSDRTNVKRWRCTHKGCTNFQPRIHDDDYVSAVLNILNRVINTPDLLDTDTPLTVYSPNAEIQGTEDEITSLCAVQPIDYEAVRSKALALVVMKYNVCTYSRVPYITQELKDCLSECKPTEVIDTGLLLKLADKITVDEHKTIAVTFKNGKHIEYREGHNAEEY